MRYLGGKVRQAKRVADVVQSIALAHGRCTYREPFVGGGSVFAESCGRYVASVASDTQEDLIALWQDMSAGWVPPDTMDRDTYERLRASTDPTALRAWAAFAVSFNGKRWAGYGPTAKGRDYVAESQRAALRKAEAFRKAGAVFECAPYSDIDVMPSDVVYCDPPYEDTTGYGSDFDHRAFWSWATRLSLNGTPVVVSEYTAPSDWVVVDAWDRSATVDATKTKTRSELLVVHRSICLDGLGAVGVGR